MPPSAILNIEPEHLVGTLSKKEHALTGTLASKSTITGTITKNASMPYYEGEYEVVSQYQEDTVINVENYVMKKNIVVKRIPKNYGKITWNGAVMTVS